MSTRLKTLSLNQFTLLTAIFYVVIFNIPLFQVVAKGIAKQSEVNWLFIATMPFFLLFAFSFIFSLFSIKYLVKPFFIILTLASSGVFYAAWQYGIIFDYGMIVNVMQTNNAEAMTYLNWMSVLSFVITGLIPAYLIYRANIEYKPFFNELLHKVVFMVAMLIGIGLIAFVYYQNYVSFGRNNDQLKQNIIPTYFIGSIAKYVNLNYIEKPLPYTQIGTDAKIVSQANNNKPNLFVMVVGETARAMNYQYFGYHRDTNAYTKELGMIPFMDTTSCGTATAVSVPCMFSKLDRASYDERHAKAQDTALDVLHHAGVKVYWLDNDSGCKGVCDRVTHIEINTNSDPKLCNGEFCYDQVLINKLKQVLSTLPEKNTNIVLHIIGSHGPTYYLRYPQSHRKFVPDCQKSDIQNCTHDELINTYDNTILYTDYILSEVVKLLQAEQPKFNTAMMYISDHGESLGESGMYLHGAPYAIAPEQQTHVPFLMWLPSQFAKANDINKQCIINEAKKGGYSQDNIFDTLLGTMHISSKDYTPKRDIFSACRTN